MRNPLKTTTFLCSVAALALTMSATPASAALIGPDDGLTLNTAPTEFYQQTEASPCVIGGNNCQNPDTFAFTLAGGGGSGSDFDETSPLYTTQQITDIAGSTFTIGLDYNDTSQAQTLYSFEAFYYDGATLLSSQLFNIETSLKTTNNGVGFSDFLLSGFVIPDATTNVQFQANWFNNDGPDRYFIIAADAPPCQVGDPGCDVTVPEPASLALFGLAAFAAGIVRRRKK